MAPSILSTPQVAALTGKSRFTVWKLGTQDPRWSACIIRQTKHSTDWSRARLIAAGILCDTEKPAAPEPVLWFDMPLSSVVG